MPDLQWASINDFKPGIRAKLSGTYPAGTASPTNTYGCYADDSGALTPLPIKFSQNIVQANTDVVIPANNSASEIRIIGLQAIGPVNNSSDVTPGDAETDTDIFVMYESYPAAGRKFELWRYSRHRLSSPGWERVWSLASVVPYAATTRPENFTMGLGRSHNADPTTTGPSVLVFVGYGTARMFPDDTAANAIGTKYLPGDLSDPINTPSQIVIPDTMVLHQGRVVIMQLTIPDFGPTTKFFHNEAMYFTAYNDFRTLGTGAQYGAITIGPENPTGYAVAVSLTANELFLVKKSGGALIVSGDVNGIGPSSPTARTLQYVKSPGMSMNNGCPTPVGYMYPVEAGEVWMWQGGDFSQNMAKQLAPDFWRPPQLDSQGAAVTYGHTHSQMTSAGQFVFCPNNYLLDTDGQSWWKVENPATFIAHRWTTDYRGRKVYGAASGWKTIADPVVREYDMASNATSFSWQSQPFSTTIDSSVVVKEIALVASGTGTVAVTVTSGQDTSGQTATYTISSTAPVVVRQSFNVRGSHITCRVVSTGTGGNEAPSVYEIRYGTMNNLLAKRS